MKKVLYLSIDGLLEPLGESQVLKYCFGISKHYKVIIFSLEKSSDLKDLTRLKLLEKTIDDHGISWYKGKYNNLSNFFSNPINLLKSLFIILKILFVEREIHFIHLRGYVLGPIVLILRRFLRIRILFDMRGFWPDEKVDRASWGNNSLNYILYEFIERRLFIESKAIVSLTHEGVERFKKFSYLKSRKLNTHVIPTCTDLELFRPASNEKIELVNFVHLGSVDTAYNILPILNFFKFFSGITDSKLTFVNRDNHDFLKRELKRLNIEEPKYAIVTSKFSDTPSFLKKGRIGLFNAKINFSIKASFPTKIGEFLASGLPIICNDFNKDVTNLIKINNIGLILDFDDNKKYMEYTKLVHQLLSDKNIHERCRAVAKNKFSLEAGIRSYLKVYKSLEK